MIVSCVPTGPRIGDASMIDSTVHSVARNCVELDAVNVPSGHELTFITFQEHDVDGIETKI